MLSLKTDEPLVRGDTQYRGTWEKIGYLFFVFILKVTEENGRIRIRGSGSVSKHYGSGTLLAVSLVIFIGFLCLVGQAPGYCGHQAEQGLASCHRV
jgi:hypothetical protein